MQSWKSEESCFIKEETQSSCLNSLPIIQCNACITLTLHVQYLERDSLAANFYGLLNIQTAIWDGSGLKFTTSLKRISQVIFQNTFSISFTQCLASWDDSSRALAQLSFHIESPLEWPDALRSPLSWEHAPPPHYPSLFTDAQAPCPGPQKSLVIWGQSIDGNVCVFAFWALESP